MAAWASSRKPAPRNTARDVRVTTIYEGTNGIQAMDLVGRKMMDGGEAAFRLFDEIEAEAEAARAALPDLAEAVWGAAETLRETRRMAGRAGDAGPLCRRGAVPVGLRPGAGRASTTSRRPAPRAAPARARALARFYIERLLPEHAGADRPGPGRGGRALCAEPRGSRARERADPVSLGRAARRGRGHRGRRRRAVDAPAAADEARPRQRLRLPRTTTAGPSSTPASTPGARRAIWEKLLAGPLGGQPVARVIVTHHHPDHVGLAGWFQRDHGAELITTRTAWLFARMLLLDEQMVPVDETLAYWRSAGMDAEVYEQRKRDAPVQLRRYRRRHAARLSPDQGGRA